MFEAMEAMFWLVGTKIVEVLLVPVIGLVLVMGLFYSALGLGSKK